MSNTILRIQSLGFPWQTQDPFLFCVHHADAYPKGNDQMGPDVSLAGRNMGNDFVIKDGFRMYHGMTVPGFPAHPHRGFETVTIVREGLVDHSDSMGMAGRFGHGDVQWMTAGKGVQHAEMFPLLNKDKDNPFELFQIWLNLPANKKMVEPHFAMLWGDTIPKWSIKDKNGQLVELSVIAGQLGDKVAPPPAPNSWAADIDNEVAIWTIKLSPGAEWTLPAAKSKVNRSLYFFIGESVDIDGQNMDRHCAIDLNPEKEVLLKNGDQESEFLLLQGKPIGEPVVQHGPFVMNSHHEIEETMRDYGRTQFGGWPWPRPDHTHPREQSRFAKYADGSVEEKK